MRERERERERDRERQRQRDRERVTDWGMGENRHINMSKTNQWIRPGLVIVILKAWYTSFIALDPVYFTHITRLTTISRFILVLGCR